MPLLPLVEMGAAPSIVPGYDMLRPISRFSHRYVYSDICSCQMRSTVELWLCDYDYVIGLSGPCKRIERDHI